MDTTEQPTSLWRRLAWFAAIWSASVAVMIGVSTLLRVWLT